MIETETKIPKRIPFDNNLLKYIKAILAAFAYVFLFSYSTSPLYQLNEILKDSYIFQIIGKYWDGQNIPYVDLFDHKGPLIFGINAVGYKITGNRYGIFAIQLVLMSIVILISFEMFRTAFSNDTAIKLTVIALVGMLAGYQGGNLTEEYILPFFMLSFFQFWKWANQFTLYRQAEHKPRSAFLYGITFGIAVMTRITNSIGICCMVLLVMVVLLKEHKWKNIVLNICFFIIGCAFIILPFILYFAMHHALYEMWFGTIEFNVSYVKNSYKIIQQSSTARKTISFLLYFFSSYCMAFTGILAARKIKRKFIGVCMVFISVITTILFAVGRAYPHYCMICLPYFVISILELKKSNSIFIWKKMGYRKLIILFSVLYLTGGIWGIRSIYRNCAPKDNSAAIENILSSIPEDEKCSFVAWNCPPYLYLKYDIKPLYRYFIIQSNQAKMSQKLKEEMHQTFQKGNVKWIMAEDGTQGIIQDILDRRYDIQKMESAGGVKYILYCEKESNLNRIINEKLSAIR